MRAPQQGVQIDFVIEVEDDREVDGRLRRVHHAQDVIEHSESGGVCNSAHILDTSSLMSRRGQSENETLGGFSTNGKSSIQASFGFK